MWNITAPPDGDLGGISLDPSEVLYEFDGPLIFRARLGLVDLVFNKVSSREGFGIYLACQTDNKTVSALKGGQLSVFGAFDRESYWIIALDESLGVKSYWNCAKSDVPKKFFPKPGFGLFHWHGHVPDTLEQSHALLAIKFRGAELTEDGIAFGKLRALLDKAADSSRRLLTPLQLARTRSSTFDFEIAPPKLASLMIAVKHPLINMKAVRRIKALDEYTRDDLEAAVRLRGAEFAAKLVEVSARIEDEHLDRAYVDDNFALLDVLSELLPDEDSYVSSVEFNASAFGETKTVVFDRHASQLIKRTVDDAEKHDIRETGVITGISAKSHSILVQSIRGKDVRCAFVPEEFDQLIAHQHFKLHRGIILTGKLVRRPRIDYLDVKSADLIPPGSLI